MSAPAAIVYLDVDDEITVAASRIRAAEPVRIAIVIPPGSRIATSRINFRLLAREAHERSRRLAVVAPDAASRAIAASAGLEVFASVSEFEAALGPPPADAGPPARPAALEPPGATTEATVVAPPAPGPVQPFRPAHPEAAPSYEPPASEPRPALRPRSAAASLPVSGPSVRRTAGGRRALAVVLGLLAVVAVVGGVAGYVFLPSAEIVVRPRVETIGPLTLDVVADPAAAAPDPATATVPAARLTLDLGASGTFEATGTRVEEQEATGQVTFSSLDTGNGNTVPAGSVVRTQSGMGFATLRDVFVPRARIRADLSIIPGEATVVIRALKAGPEGNVEANLITVVPPAEDPLLLKVRNKTAAAGGSRDEFPVVAGEDVDAAVTALNAQLSARLAEKLADPATAPAGQTLLPETAVLGDSTPTVDPNTLLGQEVATFELGLSASATVSVVDPGPVTEIADARLREAVAEGFDLVPGSVAIDVGEPTVDAGVILFAVTATGQQVRRLDAGELLAEIKGLPVDEARRLLAEYGDATITVSPDWATTIPTFDFRVTLRLEPGLAP